MRTEQERDGADHAVAQVAVDTDGVGARQTDVLTPAARRVRQARETCQIYGAVVGGAAERFQELGRQNLLEIN